jgi:hypothetical protein
MAKKPRSYPVLPGSVYVWRGFMAPPPQTYAGFTKFLGSIFVPACALLQPPVGLRAYIPTMVPQANKPAAVPDQTALMFWATPQSHDLANSTVAVRAYQNLHGDLYDMVKSHTPEVPQALPGNATAFTAEQPYYLFDAPADWMLGAVRHVVGARPATFSQQDFITAVYNWSAGFKNNPPAGLDAALVCCGNDYAVAWAHAKKPSRSFNTVLSGFSKLVAVQLETTPRPTNMPAGLWNKWPGFDLTLPKYSSMNIQLNRPPKTNPVK